MPNLDKILYLDIDTLCFTDISKLYDIDLADFKLAAVTESTAFVQHQASLAQRHENAARLTNSKEEVNLITRVLLKEQLKSNRFFNAGVILMNLRKMRADKMTILILSLIEHYSMNDQDALNFYARGDFLELDSAWNFFPHSLGDRPKIMHWTFTRKPWEKDAVPFQKEWRAYADSA